MHSVVSKLKSFWKTGVGLIVVAYLVGTMGKIGTPRAYASGKRDGIIDELVGMMRIVEAERIDNQRVDACKIGQLSFLHVLHVRDIGHSPKAIAHNGKLAVVDFHGHHLNIAYLQRLVLFYFYQLKGRDTRIEMFGKAVRDGPMEGLGNAWLRIDMEISAIRIDAQIVYASHMVVMAVRQQHGVELSKRMAQGLLAEIGAAIDKYARRFGLNKHARTQAVIMRIRALADLAGATDNGYAKRCAGSKKCQFHVILFFGQELKN